MDCSTKNCCEDSTPITDIEKVTEKCFNDDYEHINNDIEYVPENILQSNNNESDSFRQLSEQFNSVLLMSCQCALVGGQGNVCGTGFPSCVHGQNYLSVISNHFQELVLNPDRPSKDLIYECSDQCSCPSTCNNRLVQYGPRKMLQIKYFADTNKNYGLITINNIPSGGFICEYAGELLTIDEVKQRRQKNDAENLDNYIICLNERSMADDNDSKDSVITQTFFDPSRKGNIGRYLNHSCEPNCEILSIRIDGPIPRLGMLASAVQF